MICFALALLLSASGLISYPYVGAISADANSGRVLYSDNAQRPSYPASLAKVMTILLVLEDVDSGRYSLSDKVTVTDAVRFSEPTWIGLKAGDVMTVRDLIIALMVESANDSAVALAVNASGSIEKFVQRMNERALSLGMTNTKYYNPSGLPPNSRRRYPWKSFNVSTAADQLKLALKALKMPAVVEFSSIKTCDLVKTPSGYRISVTRTVGGEKKTTKIADGEKLVMTFVNNNNIMVKDKKKIFNSDGTEAVDGLKTGYINAGGSSIILTGRRGISRAVVVVLGSGPLKNKAGKVVKRASDVRDENASRLLQDALGALVW